MNSVPWLRKKTILAALFVPLLVSAALCPVETADAQAPSLGQGGTPSVFRLVGTMKGEAFSGAVIADAAGEQTFYRLNAQLPDGSQIMRVQRASIVLKRSDGMLYEIFITQDSKTAVQAIPVESAIPVVQEDADRDRRTERKKRRRGIIREAEQDE